METNSDPASDPLIRTSISLKKSEYDSIQLRRGYLSFSKFLVTSILGQISSLVPSSSNFKITGHTTETKCLIDGATFFLNLDTMNIIHLLETGAHNSFRIEGSCPRLDYITTLLEKMRTQSITINQVYYLQANDVAEKVA